MTTKESIALAENFMDRLSEMFCEYPGCDRHDGVIQCECCKESRWFCSDHGTAGGDREGDESRLTQAYPSQCWKCGGFNADE